ncbi:hypothetical protein E4T80_11185 [Muribacter muris]|uniref:Uncharacterized protein n=1 Tax=Muribacter muris TaxID=67855 RepID=A0A4Y9JUF6_9PAST|nr:hypothetical protein [Muribacter muris]MBF0786028.1 hypothetical protein [Muribacter muris]MBF0826794.1 hypothetical protein [Muribacter muris]TFV08157.1 hypothetical protein E4T80_11185 [Muribacter muris]
MNGYTVFLEDKGQDLLRLIVDKDNKIVDVQPTTSKVFVGSFFLPKLNKIGFGAVLYQQNIHPDYLEERKLTLIYKVKYIKDQ